MLYLIIALIFALSTETAQNVTVFHNDKIFFTAERIDADTRKVSYPNNKNTVDATVDSQNRVVICFVFLVLCLALDFQIGRNAPFSRRR